MSTCIPKIAHSRLTLGLPTFVWMVGFWGAAAEVVEVVVAVLDMAVGLSTWEVCN